MQKFISNYLINTCKFFFGIYIVAVLFSACKKTNVTQQKVIETNKFSPANIAVPATGLIAYWSLDNTGDDLSGNGNNGSLYNVSSTADRFGNPTGALHFDGSTSYISVPDNYALRLSNTDFTINAWVKLDSYNSSYGCEILDKRLGGANTGYTFSIGGSLTPTSTGKAGFSTNNTVGATGNTTILLNQWHMVTVVYSYAAQQLSLYVDGILDKVTDNFLTANSAITALLYIGRDNPSIASSYFFQGSLDDISIYNSAISSSTISTLYATTSTNPAPSLIAYWPLNDSGNDLSGNYNNGTMYNITSATDRFNNPVGAYHFDGATSYISVPDNAALRLSNTDFTINAWVKLDNYSSSLGSLILSKGTGASEGWLQAVIGSGASPYTVGTAVYSLGYGGPLFTSSKVLTLNQWHMVTTVYTLSNHQLSFYIDNVLDRSVTGLASPNAASTALLYIGRNNPTVSFNGFQGSLDDISIFTSALSSSSINTLYTSTH